MTRDELKERIKTLPLRSDKRIGLNAILQEMTTRELKGVTAARVVYRIPAGRKPHNG